MARGRLRRSPYRAAVEAHWRRSQAWYQVLKASDQHGRESREYRAAMDAWWAATAGWWTAWEAAAAACGSRASRRPMKRGRHV